MASANTGILGDQNTLFGLPQGDVGILGASLKDALAYFGGRPQDAGALMPAIQQSQMLHARQQLLTGINSPDAATRQQAYSAAMQMGIDPTPYKAEAAANAMPSLLQHMQPQINDVSSTPQITAPGQLGQRQAAGVYNSPIQSTPSISDALQATGSPELSAQMAPEIIKDQIARQDKAMTTLAPDQVAQLGFRPGTIVQKDAYGNLKVAQASDVKSNDAMKQTLQEKIDEAKNVPMTAAQIASNRIAQANNNISQAHLDLDRQKVSAAIPSDDTLHDMALRYVSGDKTAAGSLGRNPMAQTAFQNMISQVGKEKGLTPQQISQNQQSFQAGTKAVQAFDTGKQGDTTRSLNVFVQHSQLLDQLADAMHNGDIKAINSLSNAFKEATGNPAPTNLRSVAQIYANELQKATLGAPGGEAERQALAAAANPNVAPQVIHGLTSQGRTLAAGQLSGLRQQYKSSTGRDDFDQKLSPETISALSNGLPKVIPTVATPADALKLAPGTQFRTPDGRIKVR